MIQVQKNNDTAKITLANGVERQFWTTGKTMAGIPVFKDRAIKVICEMASEEQQIQKIVKRNNSEVILMCKYELFEEILMQTKEHEVEVQMFVTQTRKLAPYMAIGIEPAALVISCVK